MESSAFFSSCKRCGVNALGVFKCAVDVGDMAKDDALHASGVIQAVKHAMNFAALWFLKRMQAEASRSEFSTLPDV
jgi:hypothetical protein